MDVIAQGAALALRGVTNLDTRTLAHAHTVPAEENMDTATAVGSSTVAILAAPCRTDVDMLAAGYMSVLLFLLSLVLLDTVFYIKCMIL